MLVAPNGRGFRRLKEAQAAVELLALKRRSQ